MSQSRRRVPIRVPPGALELDRSMYRQLSSSDPFKRNEAMRYFRRGQRVLQEVERDKNQYQVVGGFLSPAQISALRRSSDRAIQTFISRYRTRGGVTIIAAPERKRRSRR